MNRREFLSVLGGVSAVSAVSMIHVHPAFAENTTSLYVKGLVMLDFQDTDVLRLGFPKAPGHLATLAIVPQSGSQRILMIKGRGTVDVTNVPPVDPKIFVPELVRMREFYGSGVKSHVDQCPSIIAIPSAAIRSVTTSELSKAKYTFTRVDNGEEVTTFRPRHVAETIKIDLSSAGILKLDDGKVNIPLQTTRELHVKYAPENPTEIDAYIDHFHHFFDYIERPAALDFDVIPKRLTGNSLPTPTVGNRFMMFDIYPFCFPLATP